MKEVTFYEVGMENFCLFEEPMILKLKDPGLTLITGANGSGKTTLIEAIPYTLYGTTSKGLKSDLVVNNKKGKDCYTWLEFAIGNELFRIERYRKHHKMQDRVRIFRDGKDVTPGGIRQANRMIENLVLSPNLLMSTIFFAQKVKAFFTNLTDAEQKAVFREILQLDSYTEYQKNASKHLEEANKKQQSIMSEIHTLEQVLKECRTQLESLQLEYDSFQKDKQMRLSNITNKILELRNLLTQYDKDATTREFESLNSAFQDKQNEINLESERLSRIRAEAKQKESEITNKYNQYVSSIKLQAKDKIQELDSKIQSLIQEYQKEVLSEIESVEKDTELLRKEAEKVNSEIVKLTTQRNHKDEEKKRFLELKSKENAPCPYCNQIIPEGITDIRIQEKEREIQDLVSQLQEIQLKKKEIDEELEKQRNKIQSLRIELSKMEQITNEIRALEEKKKEIKLQESSQLERAQERLELRIREISNEREELERTHLSQINQKRQEVENLRKLLDQCKKTLQYIEEIETQISIQEALLKKTDSETFPSYDSIIQLQNHRIPSIEDQIEKLKQEIPSISNQVQILEFWKKGFSPTGIPSMLIDDSIPFMNSTVQKYLFDLTGGRYSISFDTVSETASGELRDKINIRVLDKINLANDRVQLSGGQERLIDICILLTLIELNERIQNVKFNLLLLDEVFDALDDENIRLVSKLLRQISKEKTTIVISHRHIQEFEADTYLQL
jgi:DNA repair exonuclease SbcCD ATPase subunit